MTVPMITLNNGVEMPQVGYGVWKISAADTERCVSEALEAGYRHIDTAMFYRNEEAVGRAIAASGIPRGELFVTTKLWNSDQGKDSAVTAFEASRERLGLEVLDLYLIHWPMPATARYVESYLALQDGPYRDGAVRALGVSNFTPVHLEHLAAAADALPAVNQVELHPYFPQTTARAFHTEHGIATEAWAPIGGERGNVLDDPTIAKIAADRGVSPAQVVLRWHLQQGTVVIPKSANPARMASNIDLFGFELSEAEMTQIGGLDRGAGGRVGADPDTMEYAGTG